MPIKFLIDECLSPTLALDAQAAGYVESTSVRDRGLSGTQDWQLVAYAVAHDFTLVTHNAKDFRGSGPARPGGLHAQQAIHAGLVCLNCEVPGGIDLDTQRALFEVVLAQLDQGSDLVNTALEVTLAEDGESVHIVVYNIPAA